jgi:hypothetical protein
VVNVFDLLALISIRGPCDEQCPDTCAGDLDHSGSVDVLDLPLVISNWG